MRIRLIRPAMVGALWTFLAVALEGQSPSASQVVDHRNLRSVPRGFTLSAAPVWRSLAAGRPLLRITSARRLPSGEVVALEGSSLEVRTFGRDGRSQRSFGGKGNGPGQFLRSAELTVLSGNRVLAIDGMARATVFSTDGRIRRTFQLADTLDDAARRALLGTTDDGGLWCYIVRVPNRGLPGTRTGPRATDGKPFTFHDSVVVIRYDSSGTNPTIFAPLQRSVRALMVTTMTTPRGPGRTSVPVIPYPAEYEQAVGLGGQAIYIYHNDRSELSVLSLRGTVEFTVKLPTLTANVGARLGTVNFDRAEERLGFLVDSRGLLWLEVAAPKDASRTWWVITPQGRIASSVEIPANFRVLDVTDAHILGVRRGADEDFLEMHGLTRGGGPP